MGYEGAVALEVPAVAMRRHTVRGAAWRLGLKVLALDLGVVEAHGRAERARMVKVDPGEQVRALGGAGGARRGLDGRRGATRDLVGDGDGLGGLSRLHESLEHLGDLAAVPRVTDEVVGVLVDDRVQPSRPDVAVHRDVKVERAKDKHLERVDVLEGDTRHGRKGLVAVRVVLERLAGRQHKSSRRGENIPCSRA